MNRNFFMRLVQLTEEPATDNGCWLWNGRSYGQYGRLNIRARGKHRTIRAHRAMLTIMECSEEPELFFDLYEAYSIAEFECDHLCTENPLCMNPDHLQWLTKTEHDVKNRTHGMGPHRPRGFANGQQ